MTESKKIVVIMGDKDPKTHSIRYNSKDDNLKSIYIPKKALIMAFTGIPDKVRVTIEAID